MKSYLTEANTTATNRATCSVLRQPLKLLENLHQYQESLKAKMALSTSALKSITNRQKRTDSSSPSAKNSKVTDNGIHNARNRTSSISSRQKNVLNAKANSKQSKKPDVIPSTEVSDDGNTNPVGSLTSSPKWSHIKNKFENGLEKTARLKTSSNNEQCEDEKLLSAASKGLSCLSPETRFSIRKNLSAKRTPVEVSVPKPDSHLVPSKTSNGRVKPDNLDLKNIPTLANHNSAKDLYSNTARRATSNTKSSNLPKTVDSAGARKSINGISNLTKNSSLQKSLAISSVSLSSNSSKNSEVEDPPSISSTLSCNSSNNSQTNIPSACTSDSKKSKYSLSRSSSPKNSSSVGLIANASSLHSRLTSKRNIEVNQSTTRTNLKTDKPKQSDTIQIDQNRSVRKSFLTEKDRQLLSNISNINKNCRNYNSSIKPNQGIVTDTDSVINKKSIAESVEKIKNLVKCSAPSTKTVWVKDVAGNWTKKSESESKTSSQSKVAGFKSKFIEPSVQVAFPLAKSSTSTNVPVKMTRPLAKSSTTSSICDKTFIDELSKSIESKTQQRTAASNCSKIEISCSKSNKPQTKRNSVHSDAKLNIVRRAVLNIEGNSTQLSPESQNRLKAVNDKVRAQTDDDKLQQTKEQTAGMKAKNKFLQGGGPSIQVESSARKHSEKSIGDPVLPARDFLTRYRQMNRNNKKTPALSQSTVSSKQNIATESIKNVLSGTRLKSQPKEMPESNTNVTKTSSVRQDLILNLSGHQLSLKSTGSQDANGVLQPNSSFLWRCSTTAPSELSKSSTTSSVSLTSSDYRNYYDGQNYYSSLDLEIEKRGEVSEEHIYIDSQESNNSSDNYGSSNGAYENVQPKNSSEDWSDVSDEEQIKSSISSNQNGTQRPKNKFHLRQNQGNFKESQQPNDSQKRTMKETISFTDSNDTLINNEVENESQFELSDSNHFYEPVYESLGDYLINTDDRDDDDNCSISLSPDNGDSLHCSLTSLESAEQENTTSKNIDKTDSKKDKSNKISQLKRHLSWTKNDIRLELSSKFNKIKIKKNGQNSTEIGVKVHESGGVNTSPKKKTFIKCILRQKSSSSIPVKRSPSPKKESALFYVHLSMGQEKQRPFSDSMVLKDASKPILDAQRKQCESALQFKSNQQRPRYRKVTPGPVIQRPKTPPPLPPNVTKSTTSMAKSTLECDGFDFIDDALTNESSHLYTSLDPDFFQSEKSNSTFYENEVFQPSSANNIKLPNPASKGITARHFISNILPTSMSRRISEDLKLPLFPKFQTELLKSPFEEEPMYQFYQKDVQQRATLWYSAEGSESDFEDDASSKFSDTDSQPISKPPVLQSQMSAMDLVHGEGGQRTLWCEVPEVVESGILKSISSKDRKIQEAMFEVITSEASYLKSLNFLIEHFVQCSEFSGSETSILDKRERHVLFSDIQPVRDVSARLLADLEKRWLENIVLSNICDIVYHHASKYFSVYVKYCSNQLYQERLLRQLKEKRPEFVSILKRLESNSVCQGLDMHSFLMLPMQRITRLPLLIDAVFHRLSTDSPIYESCKMAFANLNKFVAECNEGARKMERMEEMLLISQQLDFSDCKGFGLLSASRWLVKKGELVQLLLDNSSRRTFGRSSRWSKIQLYFFLFTDLLVVTRKKSDDNYSVVDICPRNMLQVLSVEDSKTPLPMRLPSSYRNLFQIIMLNNKEGKTVEMLISCLLESDRTRWTDAMTPVKSENPDEKIYEEWDWPQFQCTHAYNAQQPDELSLEETDVVNVFRKMADGWFEGERIRDGVRGWFPSSHAVEIITSHVRARNLRQRYRLLMLSQSYLEEQYKAQAKK